MKDLFVLKTLVIRNVSNVKQKIYNLTELRERRRQVVPDSRFTKQEMQDELEILKKLAKMAPLTSPKTSCSPLPARRNDFCYFPFRPDG